MTSSPQSKISFTHALNITNREFLDVISNLWEDECVGRCLWCCLLRPRVDIGLAGSDAYCHQAYSTPDPPCLRPVKCATKRPIDRGATSATGGPQLLAVKSPQLSETRRKLVGGSSWNRDGWTHHHPLGDPQQRWLVLLISSLWYKSYQLHRELFSSLLVRTLFKFSLSPVSLSITAVALNCYNIINATLPFGYLHEDNSVIWQCMKTAMVNDHWS